MKLSIITINYNNARGLRKTLSSVVAQTSSDGGVEDIKLKRNPIIIEV